MLSSACWHFCQTTTAEPTAISTSPDFSDSATGHNSRLHPLREILFYGWWLAIALLSLTPGQAVGISVWDKLQHLGAYGTLMLLAGGNTARSLLHRGIALIVFSGVMELLQGLAPGRSPSLLDLVANSLGVLCGGSAWGCWLYWRHRRRQ